MAKEEIKEARSSKRDAIPTETVSKAATANDVAAAHSAWIVSIARVRQSVAAREAAKRDAEKHGRDVKTAEKDSEDKYSAYMEALETTGVIPARQ
jgi:hypothetical protein